MRARIFNNVVLHTWTMSMLVKKYKKFKWNKFKNFRHTNALKWLNIWIFGCDDDGSCQTTFFRYTFWNFFFYLPFIFVVFASLKWFRVIIYLKIIFPKNVMTPEADKLEYTLSYSCPNFNFGSFIISKMFGWALCSHLKIRAFQHINETGWHVLCFYHQPSTLKYLFVSFFGVFFASFIWKMFVTTSSMFCSGLIACWSRKETQQCNTA